MVPELVRAHLVLRCVFRWTEMSKPEQHKLLEGVIKHLHDQTWMQSHIDYLLKMDRSWAWSKVLHGVISAAIYKTVEEQL